jgi:predicted lipoprotein with Yx(FWY)xxD motif
MHHFYVRALATAAVAALALAACGSSSKPAATSNTNAPSTTAAPDTTTAAPSTTVAPADATVTLATTKVGKVVVDSKGMTLYRFDNDTVAGKSTCGAGPCASTWPAAIVTGTPTPGAGIEASKLSTFKRADDGKTQLQIGGHPVYTFAGDAKAGDTNGQGILGKWYAVGPGGDKVGDKT